MNNVLLTTSYWPNLHYFYYVFNSEKITIEIKDHYQKQSFRNRTTILSANGPLNLQIPVKKLKEKEMVQDIEISYTDRWQAKHWGAIKSAYGNSPYFEFFENEIFNFYDKQYLRLLDFNIAQLVFILKAFKIKKEILFSTEYERESLIKDLRDLIHPKITFELDLAVKQKLSQPYYQTFSEKLPFTPNLSILDLLFNTGLGSLKYLSE